MFVNTSERNYFNHSSDNVTKACSYGVKTSKNIDMKYIFHYKAYFNVLDLFHMSCLSTFKNNLKLFWEKSLFRKHQ